MAIMHPNRREILKALAAAGVLGAAMPFGLKNLAFAADSSSPLLIVLHLRGGCDGLNFISPADDPDFIAARSSDLRVLTDGKDAGFSLANGPASHIDFRLHAAAGGLNELYKAQNLAFIHASGLTDSTRSHFVATDMIESGVGTQADLSRAETGWLARAIEGQARSASNLEAISIGGSTTGDLQGLDHVLAAPDINNGLPLVGGSNVAAVLWQMYSNHSGALGESGQLALQLPTLIDQRILRDGQGHPLPYQPENGANYDKAGGVAGPLKSIARLIKMDIGLNAVTMDYGGWDTHEYQAGRFHGLIEPLSNGLAAFWNDISAYHSRVVMVALTEFGRRLRSNKSSGTDHGRGGLMFVLGGNVRGGKFYGEWPGLSTAQLDESVDLAVTTDYRRVLIEVLEHVNGQRMANIFPNYRYPGSLVIL